jgi:hypothetical protein
MCHLCFSLEDQSRLEVMKTRLHRNGHAASSSELRWDESFHRRDQFGLRARLVGVRQKAREQAETSIPCIRGRCWCGPLVRRGLPRLLLPCAQMYHVRTCERSVAVHHREPGNSDPAKMLALCLACHAKVKGGRVGESLCDWSVWSVV